MEDSSDEAVFKKRNPVSVGISSSVSLENRLFVLIITISINWHKLHKRYLYTQNKSQTVQILNSLNWADEDKLEQLHKLNNGADLY